MNPDEYDPTDSEAFNAAFGAWTLTLIDKGIAVNAQQLTLFRYAFRAGYAYGEDA